MKNLLIPIALTSIATGAFASENNSFYIENQRALHYHNFSPIAFYKIHKEGNYNYEFTGVGVKYEHLKQKGLNFGASLLSNLETETTYIETESFLSVNFKTDWFYFSPKLISKNITHQIEKNLDNRTLIQKGTSYIGMGLKPNYDYPIQVTVEAFLFRDLYNTILIEEGGKFHGIRFTNPFGFRTDLNLSLDAIENLCIELKGSYAKSFEDEYWEGGAQLALSWRY